jgi:hypothetical protein
MRNLPLCFTRPSDPAATASAASNKRNVNPEYGAEPTRLSTVLKLQLRQSRVETAGSYESLVRTFLNDTALLHHQDAVA